MCGACTATTNACSGWVVTPRRGKAVEINALWYDALCFYEQWLREEELDDKLRTSGLNPDEIRLFEDITNIKEFLNSWPPRSSQLCRPVDVRVKHLPV